MKTTVYKREVVNYPFNSRIEYYTDKELADKAYEAADASNEIYIHDRGKTETTDLELYLYGHISTADDYNNSPEKIREKCLG